MAIAKNLVGSIYGKLTVIARAENKGKEPCWACVCTCGRHAVIRGMSLKNGATQSCGCIARKKTKERSVTHGMYGTPEWHAWAAMRARCAKNSCKSFKDYGARGITVCERWDVSFESFYEDMGPRPSTDHQLDRIDNNSGYSPDNCRWATRCENMRNRRVTVRYGGLTLREIADKTGENYNTLKTRAFRGLMQRDC